jgi:hypothetical protein
MDIAFSPDSNTLISLRSGLQHYRDWRFEQIRKISQLVDGIRAKSDANDVAFHVIELCRAKMKQLKPQAVQLQTAFDSFNVDNQFSTNFTIVRPVMESNGEGNPVRVQTSQLSWISKRHRDIGCRLLLLRDAIVGGESSDLTASLIRHCLEDLDTIRNDFVTLQSTCRSEEKSESIGQEHCNNTLAELNSDESVSCGRVVDCDMPKDVDTILKFNGQDIMSTLEVFIDVASEAGTNLPRPPKRSRAERIVELKKKREEDQKKKATLMVMDELKRALVVKLPPHQL